MASPCRLLWQVSLRPLTMPGVGAQSHGTTLIANEAGLTAIGVEPVKPSAVDSARVADTDPAQPPEGQARRVGRAGTKQAQIIAMLQRPQGQRLLKWL